MSEPINTVPMLQTYRSVTIQNKEGDKFDITSAVAEFSIYEDMFSNVLVGDILYVDEHGGLSDIKFIGGEKVTIELYKSADSDETDSYEFFVYHIGDWIRDTDATSGFKIQFMSFEAVLNANTRCYAAYLGSNNETVKQLFGLLESDKKIETEKTKGKYKFVMPSNTPFEAINWYAGRSISEESNGSFFLFYETLKDGFKFKSVDTMAEQSPTFGFRYEPRGTEFLVKDTTNIREYEIIQTINSFEGFDEHYTTLWNADPARKKLVKQMFDADDVEPKLNKGEMTTTQRAKNGFDLDLKARRELFGTRTLIRGEVRNTHSQTEAYYYDSLQPKLSAIRQYDGVKLRCLLFGNREIQVGQVVTMDFMKTRMYDSESKSESKDYLLSGNYIVTAVRYIYKINEFNMSIEVVKDTKST